MDLIIDIGNSSIVFALFEDDKFIHKFRLNSDKNKSVDDFNVDIIENILSFSPDFDFLNLKKCVIASVVDSLKEKIKNALTKFLNAEILTLENEFLDNLIEIKLENKKEIGADRLINAIYGAYLYQKNLIIIDFGTATTFDVVDQFGAYVGGAICPGVNLSIKTLHEMTDKLPKIELTKQEKIIGKNTVEAMNSGIYFGYIAMINGMIQKIQEELNQKCQIILTGGFCEIFKNEIDHNFCQNDENFTIKAMNYIKNL